MDTAKKGESAETRAAWARFRETHPELYRTADRTKERAMEIVTEIKERLAQPGAKSATEELLGRAGGEIERLRGQYEPRGVVDPWTGAWQADGVVTVPTAHLDAAGRPVATGATHAKDAQGRVVKVEAPARAAR